MANNRLAVMLVPEHLAPDIRRYVASQGRAFTSTQSKKDPSKVIPPISTELRSRNVMQLWPSAALG
jgi:hypothetical protein